MPCPFDRSFDHHEPGLSEDLLWPAYTALRDSGRVARSDRHGGFWILSHFDDVREALLSPEIFSSAAGHRIPEVAAARAIPIDYDPPTHTAYREVIRPALQPRRVRALTGFLRETVRDLLRRFHEEGGGDFVAGVALPLPLAVLTEIVGFSDEAVGRFRGLTERIAAAITDEQAQRAAREEFRATLRAEVERHRRERPDDYLTALLDTEIDGRPLEEQEVLSILTTLALAGHETTMNAASHLLWLLASDPAVQSSFRADPSLAPRYVEEMLRLRTPAQMFARRLTADLEIGGTILRAGDQVLLLYGAANRDEGRFDHAEAFDVDRSASGHLAFGWGVHHCIGAPLARVELRILLEELAALPPILLAGEPRFGHIEAGVHYGLRELPLRFDECATAAVR
ncbi:MAG: cytochrome P450 [Pseudonocardia sp.]|uniref:cytochrome P450 n=1 Tax=Pseudonocardia sp. TaxID=60912 RepID=UPI001ACB7B28|nr:cytochrome P450 [Pseudonocardia sp.]MBN9102418.1 cytochrome P450 [Pseudonocardia sp.]